MEEQTGPEAPLCGMVYGDTAFWTCAAGVAIGAAGLVWYLAGGGGVMEAEAMLESLWGGGDVAAVWRDAAGREAPAGHWYLGYLDRPDGLAMLGAVVCCMGGVLGTWGALVSMLVAGREKKRPQNRLYATFCLVAAVLLTLCAAGVFAVR
ncbi:MAG: DUF1634 domain-containing protein [Planctomycetes bacterium]|nr:DUF1634 domain-containing protein [Planctomycetota bacterium]